MENYKQLRSKNQNGSSFLKYIYLLTNDKIVNAADLLALVLSQLPNVTKRRLANRQKFN